MGVDVSRIHDFELKSGRKLGRNYRILDVLGKGWEGEVYKVEEQSTGIIRAAKIFYKHRYKKDLPHVSYAKRLYSLRNCPIVIKYHHQDIVKIKNQKIDFLVSDFVDGVVLSEFINKHPQKRLLPFEALHLLYALVQGIEQIHFLGEYHGDIHSDNIIVNRRGLGFDVYLIDLLHLGKANKIRIQHDVIDLINVFYEIIGGNKFYQKMPQQIKEIIMGRKHSLIEKKFKEAGHLRIFIENMEW